MPVMSGSRRNRGRRPRILAGGGMRTHSMMSHPLHESDYSLLYPSLYSSSSLLRSCSFGLLVSSPAMAIMINQAMFFLLCDKIFCPRQKLTGLYSLLFYNVAAYLISYGKEIIDARKGYTPYVVVSEHSNIRHLAMSATKVVLDITKFITFGITCVFIILVFGVPGHNQFSPTWCYMIITIVYYILTEPWTHENATNWLSWFQVEFFENLEVLWAPVLIRLFSSFASGTLIALVWFLSSPSSLLLIMTSAYVNVYLCLREMDEYWKALLVEKSCLDKYRYATRQELEDHQDDVCAVCLNPMKWKARITPCLHMFHSDCLRNCLKQNYQMCPICKCSI